MAEIKIKIELLWIKDKTDCSECCGCDEIIYSNMYSGVMLINKSEFEETKYKLCESCFYLTDFKLLVNE